MIKIIQRIWEVNKVNVRSETVKAAIGGIIATVFKYLGTNYKIVTLLMCFMAVDTALGWLGNAKKGTWKSKDARWGAVGKLVELIIIALMYLCEWAFALDWLTSVVTMYFALCEGASIIENIVNYHLNDNIPEGIVDVLTKAKGSVISAVVKKIKKLFEGGDTDE
jgi:toxin secretion/phage lysis holin